MLYLRLSQQSLRFIFIVLVNFTAIVGIAQPQNNPPAYITPSGLFDTVIDRFGHKYPLGAISINQEIRARYTDEHTAEPMIVPTCSSGYFQLYLATGCGMENFATDATHNARLTVMCQVLNDLSQFIQSPLSTSSQKVNIWVKPSITGAVLGIASPFFNMPGISSVSGIVDNTAWITINSGEDAFKGVCSPIHTSGGGTAGSTFFHGSVQFNFTTFPLHTDLTTTPLPGEQDFYTIALHEMMHVLGFMSLIDIDGRSVFNSNSSPGINNYRYYSRYDTRLFTQSGTSILSHSGLCSVYDWSFNSSLVASDVLAPVAHAACSTPPDHTTEATAILYNGSTTQYVYTPDCFAYGGSLSHFEDEHTAHLPPSFTVSPSNNQYFVMTNAAPSGDYDAVTNPGIMRRYPKPEERHVLCDIGYKVNTSFGNSTNLNLMTYTGGVCGYQVAGINDGIAPAGGFLFSTTPFTGIDINAGSSGGSFLNNDHNASSFKCLETVLGSGSLSATSGNAATLVTYTPAAIDFGINLLRYIPVDASGNEGNITYITIYVSDMSCVATACNMVTNSDFEDVVPGYSYCCSWPGNVHCWGDYHSPDIYARGALIPNTSIPSPAIGAVPDIHPDAGGAIADSHFVAIASAKDPATGQCHSEGIHQTLITPLVPGSKYAISFWIYSQLPVTHLAFATTAAPSGYASSITGMPAGFTQFYDHVTHSDEQWHFISDTFTYNGTTPEQELNILGAPWLIPSIPPPTSHNYLGLDDIRISPITSACTFTIVPYMCHTEAPFDLSNNTCGKPGIFTWETLPVVGGAATISHSPIFDPASALAASLATGRTGKITIRFDYTESGGCASSLWAETQIDPVITGAKFTCVGAHTQLSDVYAGGVWSITNTAIATINPVTGLAHGVILGVTDVNYTYLGCTHTQTFAVISGIPPIIGPATICLNGGAFFSNAVGGGTWSTTGMYTGAGSFPGFTVVASSGTGLGIDTVYYTVGGCVTKSVIEVVDIIDIYGASTINIAATTTLSTTVSGGIWSSSSTAVATVDSTTGVVTGTSAGTAVITYLYDRVPGMSGAGCITVHTITVTPDVSLVPSSLNKRLQDYSISPNPSDGNIAIVQHIEDPDKVEIQVTDVLGRKVHLSSVVFTNKRQHLRLNDLPAGVYFLLLTDSSGRRFSCRIIKE